MGLDWMGVEVYVQLCTFPKPKTKPSKNKKLVVWIFFILFKLWHISNHITPIPLRTYNRSRIQKQIHSFYGNGVAGNMFLGIYSGREWVVGGGRWGGGGGVGGGRGADGDGGGGGKRGGFERGWFVGIV